MRKSTKRKKRRRKYSRKFTGKRTDTEKVDTYYSSDCRGYIVRRDGSKYPKLTAISVSQSVKSLLKYMKADGGYENYDEFLLHLVEKGSSRRRNKFDRETFDKLTTKVKQDCRFRKISRDRAREKGRYFGRRSSIRGKR